MKHRLKSKHSTGAISILVLIFGLTASVLVGGLIIVTMSQYGYAQRNLHNEQALSIAEAGIEYYRWHLAHDPNDYSDGTDGPGPYLHSYTNPSGTLTGSFELDIAPPTVKGSSIFSVTSTGWTEDNPGIKRAIKATFGIPSLAEFAFLHNSNVWFGVGMKVIGPVRTNGGIRQDGENTSTLETSKNTYTCGVESGCEPSLEKPGIWGNGGPQELWRYPVTNIDFNQININFNLLKNTAQNEGLYRDYSGTQGYHVVFKADGTFDLFQIMTTNFYKGWSYDYGCENLYQTVVTESFQGNFSVADNPIIFIEDNVWVEGTVNGQVTLVAARFPIDSYKQDIWIPNNLVYLDRSGQHKLGLIAQHDIIFARNVPDQFEVNGALLAQSSRILRHHYNYKNCKPDSDDAYHRNKLTIYGAVISNLISYWNFSGGGSGQPTSGFAQRELIYDESLYYEPPPLFPSSGRVQLISWDEVKPPR